ncbi:hypothetical protein D3C78_1465320 [compost metagenome]
MKSIWLAATVQSSLPPTKLSVQLAPPMQWMAAPLRPARRMSRTITSMIALSSWLVRLSCNVVELARAALR